ncbi:MAG: FAD-dependent oxidoreductase [Bacteroidota bacterium]|nr:FAD-dependent oxidoreductase [Bacteroidota bacterium]
MKKEINIALPPSVAFDREALNQYVIENYSIRPSDEFKLKLLKRSIDARSRQIKVNIQAQIIVNEPLDNDINYKIPLNDVQSAKTVVIVGCGPAGMFAALQCIELGLKPIIIERGKNVRDRRRDLAALNKQHIVHPDSNYCFGEGGAGTYSDGKLYTRSDKRGDVKRILEILYAYGAPEEILFDAHPHIGTNKLPQVVTQINDTIIKCGGEIHFNERVTDLILEKNTIKGITTHTGKHWETNAVILATGHSARDIFYMLDAKNIEIHSKPYALGVRVEHPQALIDSIQYKCDVRDIHLPPSSYALVSQTYVNQIQKGVFSFCMCPGGIIAPCATEPGEIVVNGWSPSGRNNKWANSGIVVSIDESNWAHLIKDQGKMASLEYQKIIEKKACVIAGNTQVAPAQILTDFIQNKHSRELPESSYLPGTTSIMMDDVLPIDISTRLRSAFIDYGKKMKGYVTSEAQILGVESRTSSPIRIPRDKETMQHTHIQGLFPCGEGAGYAGGIVSAAMDGENAAKGVKAFYAK